MNINILTLKSPFSFFCVTVENMNEKSSHVFIDERKLGSPTIPATHGQYVAVFWQNKWTRGIVVVESNLMIWLVDFGIHIRPDDKTLYVELPAEYKKQPSTVFEASIHGIVPLEKIVNMECQIENKVSKSWNKGAVDKAQELIKNAQEFYFEPVAILNTKYNDVVLGNLYIKMLQGNLVNIIDELEKWPIFVERNPDMYIKYLSTYYQNRKIHRACLEKPNIYTSELPILTINEETLNSYQGILNNIPKTINDETIDNSDAICTVIAKKKTDFELSPSEMAHYSDMFITINGVEHNALELLLNKIKDLKMCEKYQNAVSVGRGVTNRILYKKYL